MDVLHDNSHRTWHQLGTAHEELVPDYVMNYSLPTKEAASKIDDELFADPARRLFPVDTPASTWLSAAYFAKHAADGDLPYRLAEKQLVWNTIVKAADIHGVTIDVNKINSVLTAKPQEKQAEDCSANYGWVIRNEKGDVAALKYPMFDARGVKMASAYFSENRNHYPLAVRREISGNIVKKATEFGLDVYSLDRATLKEAGLGIPRKDVLMSELLERAHLVKDAEVAVVLANINELVANTPANEVADSLDKLAEVLEEFDKFAGITRHYGRKIMMPSDFLFDVDLKEAEAALEDTVELDKYMFSLSKLAELPVKIYADVLGEDFAGSIVKSGEKVIDKDKLADNLHSLPRPDRAALETHLSALYR